MARARPPDRFQQLLGAGLRVFARKGVRRARMADIAREMGVSPGSLYNYVESKQALFHWIVARGADDGVIETPAELPIRAPAPPAADEELRRQLAAAFHLPAFEAACARRRTADARAELAAIVRELYDRIARARGPMTVVERSALDLPALYEVYFVDLRRGFFRRFARYVERQQKSGHFRSDVDATVAARFVVESVTYFARHRFGDADQTLLPADEETRENVIRLAVASLLPERAPARRSRR